MANPNDAQSTDSKINEQFSNDQIAELLRREKIKPMADLETFASGVRKAVEIYQRDRSEPNQNNQFKEIENLFKKSRRLHEVQVELKKQKGYPSTRLTAEKIETYTAKAEVEAIALSLALSRLSSATINLLNDRGRQRYEKMQLPSPYDATKPETHDDVCDRIFSLCTIGRRRELGRDRGGGKRSETVAIKYYAPKQTRHPAKREAEMTFIMWVQVAWTDATGSPPSLAASYERRGPFVRLIDTLFRWMDVEGASAVELINQLNSRRNRAIAVKSNVP
jgi:hypothetical protein